MHFNSIEEVISNELFSAWYFKADEHLSKQWELWMLEHPDSLPLVEQSISFLNETRLKEKELSEEQVEAAYHRVKEKIQAAPVVQMKSAKKRWFIPAAAAVVLLITGAALFYNFNNKEKLRSDYGSISQYKLPDGSQVMLNANSTLSMNEGWQKGTDREVWLKGEAFFHVQKTPMHNKFIVHANKMDIIVTGTQFNVVSREDESSVLLTEGSVIIKTSDGKEIHMKPGDYVQLDNNKPSLKTADQEKILAWKQSKIDFENTSLTDVAKTITRYYGVKVTIDDPSIANKTVTGIMPNDNLDVLIESLEALGDFKITKQNDEIIISGL